MSLAQVSNDLLLERIEYQRPPVAPAPIGWPDGLAPRGTAYDRAADEPLPPSDVVVVTWTVAEAQALADALTPGIPSTSWSPTPTGGRATRPSSRGARRPIRPAAWPTRPRSRSATSRCWR